MHVDWNLTQPVKALDYPDRLQPGARKASSDGEEPPACAFCHLRNDCGAVVCPNRPKVAQ